MALQTTGTISVNDIQTEFGGDNPISINEYYRGGDYVPNNTINNIIPTTGTISLNNFYGARAFYGIQDANIVVINPFVPPPGAGTQLIIQNDGTVFSGIDSYNWLRTQSNSAADYDVQVFLSSNTIDTITGTFGSWLNLATSRSFYFENTIADSTQQASVIVYLRLASTQVIVSTASISILLGNGLQP